MHGTIELPQTGEMPGEHLGNVLRQVSKTSMSEIDNLIGELQTLRRKPTAIAFSATLRSTLNLQGAGATAAEHP